MLRQSGDGRMVLDRNIFVSALLVSGSGPAQIVDLVRERKIELLVSPLILIEIAGVMRYPKIQKRHRLSPEQLDDLMATYAAFAIVRQGKRRVRASKKTSPTTCTSNARWKVGRLSLFPATNTFWAWKPSKGSLSLIRPLA